LKKVGNQTNTYYEYCGSQWGLVTDILQNIFFCVQQNKEIQTGMKQLDGV